MGGGGVAYDEEEQIQQKTPKKTGKELFFERQISPFEQGRNGRQESSFDPEKLLWESLEQQHPQVAQAFYDIQDACPQLIAQATEYPFGGIYSIAPSGRSQTSPRSVWLAMEEGGESGSLVFAEAAGNNRYSQSTKPATVAADLYKYAADMGYIQVKRTERPSGKMAYSIEAGPAFRL